MRTIILSVIIFVSGPVMTAASEIDAVAQLVVVRLTENPNTGTAYAVDDRGTMLTAYHVIDGAGVVNARILGHDEPIPCDFVWSDPEKDLALIRLRNRSSIGGLKLANLKNTHAQHDLKMVHGSYGLHGTADDCRFLGLRSSHEVKDKSGNAIFSGPPFELLQLSGHVGPGASGAPVVSTDGVVGTITAGPDQARGGMFFAVPSSYVDLESLNADVKSRFPNGQPLGFNTNHTDVQLKGGYVAAPQAPKLWTSSGPRTQSLKTEQWASLTVNQVLPYVDDPLRFVATIGAGPQALERAIAPDSVLGLINAAMGFTVCVPETFRVVETYDAVNEEFRTRISPPRGGSSSTTIIVRQLQGRLASADPIEVIDKYAGDYVRNELKLAIMVPNQQRQGMPPPGMPPPGMPPPGMLPPGMPPPGMLPPGMPPPGMPPPGMPPPGMLPPGMPPPGMPPPGMAPPGFQARGVPQGLRPAWLGFGSDLYPVTRAGRFDLVRFNRHYILADNSGEAHLLKFGVNSGKFYLVHLPYSQHKDVPNGNPLDSFLRSLLVYLSASSL